ncbi:MAG TPA: amidohydrolase [Candidatus Acidoferrum sp.]|nr:amidohydrolase [Candidatus Acidoferrum sp.]
MDTMVSDEILRRTKSLYPTLVKWRRHFHSLPELSDVEFQTTAFLKAQIKKQGLRILPIDLPTGLLVELSGKVKGPTVAIRSDIDALPVTELNAIPFRSKNVGIMHACGHDMHMATVLGAATVLAQLKSHVRGKIRFLFQPAEEMPPGGARPMIENGALRGVSHILGLHVDPDIPVGTIGLRDGATMASVFDFDLIVQGRSGHAAKPHLAVDAITVAAEIIESLQKIVSRETDPVDPVVITFGKISGGRARNVIVDEVHLEGTARTLSAATQKKLPALIRRTVDGICRAHDAGFRLLPIATYPVLKNDPKVNKVLARNFEALFGKGRINVTEPVLGSEDFACYLEKVPGAMFRLGVRNPKIKADQPWHSSRFMADENALIVGVALLAAAALEVAGETA